MKQYLTPQIVRRAHPESDLSHLHAEPLIARILGARGAQQGALKLDSLHSPDSLSGMAAAVALLNRAIIDNRRIVIVGDYDADGATATALCVKSLRQLGAQQVAYFIPDRMVHGYGLSPAVVDEISAHLKPELLITVDNGIASHTAIAQARAAGIDVLVTDHHLPSETLPDATVILNPNVPGDTFPSKNLAGVGVAFYLLCAARSALASGGWFAQRGIAPPNLATHLDLVALGTIADVVPLDHNNRVLIEQGLRRIRAGGACAGIAALLRVAKLDPRRVRASDMAFQVAPRLNAAGRIDKMTRGVSCLLATDTAEANQIASALDQINKTRRDVGDTMQEQAEQALQKILDQLPQDTLPAGVCLYDPSWHEGIIGILAGRVRECVHRPTIVLTCDRDNKIKGSGRSIPEVHLRDVLVNLDHKHPALIQQFGGHAMAAGLTMAADQLTAFQECFEREVADQLQARTPDRTLYTDGPLSEQHFSFAFAEALHGATPWGQAFTEPLFEGEFRCVSYEVLKRAKDHLKLKLSPLCAPQLTLDAIAFNQSDQTASGAPLGEHLYLVYKLDINWFGRQPRVQLVIEYLENTASTMDV